jgi:hypothetical protein
MHLSRKHGHVGYLQCVNKNRRSIPISVTCVSVLPVALLCFHLMCALLGKPLIISLCSIAFDLMLFVKVVCTIEIFT